MNFSHRKEMSLCECEQRGWNFGGSGELGTGTCSELPEREVTATVVTIKRLSV